MHLYNLTLERCLEILQELEPTLPWEDFSVAERSWAYGEGIRFAIRFSDDPTPESLRQRSSYWNYSQDWFCVELTADGDYRTISVLRDRAKAKAWVGEA